MNYIGSKYSFVEKYEEKRTIYRTDASIARITCRNDEMFLDFKNIKNIDLIKEKVIQVNKLEELGDRTYEKLMTMLYTNEKNPIDLIKWTNIYNCLENTIDSCEEISSCIEDVIIKNS